MTLDQNVKNKITLEEKINRWKVSKIKNIGPQTFLKILDKFENATNFLNSDKKYQSILKDKCTVNTDSFIVYGETKYSELLSHITDPPIVLYFKGDINLITHPKLISIVGTRKFSTYGELVTSKLTKELVENGYITVSGLAKGIDTIVHNETLNSGGKTIAVLGGPINQPYPRENTKLYNEIIDKGGVIISEVMVGEKIHAWQFPRRNRIVAGLASKTIVTEAPNRSGALITANLAFDFNREVYAVPANINLQNSIGCNKLISLNKAQLLYDFSIITGYTKDKRFDISAKISNCSNKEKRILSLLQAGENKIDLLIEKTEMDTSEVSKILLELELGGFVTKNLMGEYEFLN